MPDDNIPTNNLIDFFTNIWTEYKGAVVLGIISLGLIGAAFVMIIKSVSNAAPIKFTDTSDSVASESAKRILVVDVAGGVVHPGVYELPVNSRIEDAIKIAGGLSENADEELIAKSINRAMKVGDGVKIFIPEINPSNMSHNNSFTTSTNTEIVDTTQIGIIEGSQNNSLISINQGSQSQLDTLPGIGIVTADKIISNRPYGRIEDLLDRKIVKPSVYEKIKNLISL